MVINENRSPDKDLVRYMVRWVAFGAVAGLFSPVVSQGFMTDGEIWGIKLHHLLFGLLFGAACGYAFTLSQNRFNITRDKKITWGIAIALWMGFNFAFAGVSMV